jgi:hypothetical protein
VQSEGRRDETEREDAEVEEVVMMIASATASDLVAPICEALHLGDPNLIREIRLTPRDITVVRYRLNENGSKFADPDTGWVATEMDTFRVTG